jgi:nucleotide-binding universal stress UspA family protein
MRQYKKIIFPTDYSICAEHAFNHAVYLASEHNADLHVLHITDPKDSEEDSVLVEELPREGTEEANTALQGFGATGENAPHNRLLTVLLHGENPASKILEYAEKHEADLIVMGTHGRRGFRRFIAGSVTEQVVRSAKCPVLTVGEQTGQKPDTLGQRFLVPVDFSEVSRGLLQEAKELALTYRARVHLLHVVQESVYPIVYGIEPVVPLAERVGIRAHEELRRIGEEAFGAEVTFQAEVIVGNPIRAITGCAERDGFGMIILATHGLTGLKHLLLGSVTEAVVRTAPCPVYTVRSPGRGEAPAEEAGRVRRAGRSPVSP